LTFLHPSTQLPSSQPPTPDPKPTTEGLAPELAAALPIAYGTADLALRHRGKLAAGQTLLVLGASGGVGTAAVQVRSLSGGRERG